MLMAEVNLLPVGLAEGCTLLRDIPRDYVLTFDDVQLPEDNLVLRLYREQTEKFFPSIRMASQQAITENAFTTNSPAII